MAKTPPPPSPDRRRRGEERRGPQEVPIFCPWCLDFDPQKTMLSRMVPIGTSAAAPMREAMTAPHIVYLCGRCGFSEIHMEVLVE
ncbi:MAG: hypothetical protein Q8S13_00135 [Dehalococcoidia bacterium]|nr:hypothetical protein [Dehalococcoidia bacterium]